MEIKNTTFFLIGIIVLVLGASIVVFDYPQIQYFEQMTPDAQLTLDPEEKDIYQRLLVEIVIGIIILSAGALLVILSMREKFP